MDEPCKVLRQQLAERMRYKGMSVPDWKREPSCGCKGNCRRIQNSSVDKYDAYSKNR